MSKATQRVLAALTGYQPQDVVRVVNTNQFWMWGPDGKDDRKGLWVLKERHPHPNGWQWLIAHGRSQRISMAFENEIVLVRRP